MYSCYVFIYGEIVGQNEYGHVYVEATSMPLPDRKDLTKNTVGINLKESRVFRRVQVGRSNE